MNVADLPELAAGWAAFMSKALLDGTLVFLLAALLWLPLRGRAPAQLGYGLFLLVLVELALPLQVPAPAWLAALSPRHALQGLWAPPADSEAVVPAALEAGLADAAPLPAAPGAFGLEAWLLLGWSVVVAVLFLRFVWLQVRTARIVSNARAPRAGELGVDWADLHRRMGLRRRVALRITDRLDSPAAGGLLRPYVLLPEGLTRRVSDASLSWVLLHELAHVRRRDAWVALLQRLMQIAFFFHPAVWLANRMLDEQREFACDDAALLACGERRSACGEGFLSVVEWAQTGRTVPVVALGAFRSRHLTRRRLMRILDAHRKPGRRSALFSGLFVAALGLLLVPNLEAQEARGEGAIEHRIKQQEIAILKARLEKLRLESELLQMELQRLQGGEPETRNPLRRSRGSLGRGRGLGGGRARADVPGSDVPDSEPAPRRRGARGLRGSAPDSVPEGRSGRLFRGRAVVPPGAPRPPRAPRAPRAPRPDTRSGVRGRLPGLETEAPPAPPQPPEPPQNKKSPPQSVMDIFEAPEPPQPTTHRERVIITR